MIAVFKEQMYVQYCILDLQQLLEFSVKNQTFFINFTKGFFFFFDGLLGVCENRLRTQQQHIIPHFKLLYDSL